MWPPKPLHSLAQGPLTPQVVLGGMTNRFAFARVLQYTRAGAIHAKLPNEAKPGAKPKQRKISKETKLKWSPATAKSATHIDLKYERATTEKQ